MEVSTAIRFNEALEGKLTLYGAKVNSLLNMCC